MQSILDEKLFVFYALSMNISKIYITIKILRIKFKDNVHYVYLCNRNKCNDLQWKMFIFYDLKFDFSYENHSKLL